MGIGSSHLKSGARPETPPIPPRYYLSAAARLPNRGRARRSIVRQPQSGRGVRTGELLEGRVSVLMLAGRCPDVGQVCRRVKAQSGLQESGDHAECVKAWNISKAQLPVRQDKHVRIMPDFIGKEIYNQK